jgi:hypothetical protein
MADWARYQNVAIRRDIVARVRHERPAVALSKYVSWLIEQDLGPALDRKQASAFETSKPISRRQRDSFMGKRNSR